MVWKMCTHNKVECNYSQKKAAVYAKHGQLLYSYILEKTCLSVSVIKAKPDTNNIWMCDIFKHSMYNMVAAET